jgi:hypothetical protein
MCYYQSKGDTMEVRELEDLPVPPGSVQACLDNLISASEAARLTSYTRQGIHEAKKHLWHTRIGTQLVFWRPQVEAYAQLMERMGAEKYGIR